METRTHTHLLFKSHINHSERKNGAPGLVWRAWKNLFNHSWLEKRLRIKEQRGAAVVVAAAAKRLITQGRSW